MYAVMMGFYDHRAVVVCSEHDSEQEAAIAAAFLNDEATEAGHTAAAFWVVAACANCGGYKNCALCRSEYHGWPDCQLPR